MNAEVQAMVSALIYTATKHKVTVSGVLMVGDPQSVCVFQNDTEVKPTAVAESFRDAADLIDLSVIEGGVMILKLPKPC